MHTSLRSPKRRKSNIGYGRESITNNIIPICALESYFEISFGTYERFGILSIYLHRRQFVPIHTNFQQALTFVFKRVEKKKTGLVSLGVQYALTHVSNWLIPYRATNVGETTSAPYAIIEATRWQTELACSR